MLIPNLHKLGFSGELLLWISDNLKDWSKRVVLNEFVPVTSDGRQGSTLRLSCLLLFVLLINARLNCTCNIVIIRR